MEVGTPLYEDLDRLQTSGGASRQRVLQGEGRRTLKDRFFSFRDCCPVNCSPSLLQ